MRIKIDGAKLAYYLQKNTMSVSALAELTGLHRGTLSAVKSGKTCNLATARAIAAALNIPLEQLIEQ